MSNEEIVSGVQNLYDLFSKDPYKPTCSWTICVEFNIQEFKLAKPFVEDPVATATEFVKQQIPKI